MLWACMLTTPLENKMVCEVKLLDGDIKDYSANVIAENMFTQVDANGHTNTLIESIIDYKKGGSAVDLEDLYSTMNSVQRRMRQTTSGWKLLVLWKYGSEQLIPLNVLKDSNPVELSEFVKAH